MDKQQQEEYLKEKDKFYNQFLEENTKLQEMIDSFDKKFGLTEDDEDDKKNKEESNLAKIKISEMKQNIAVLKDKRQDILEKVLGCLYEGILIDGKLSFRKGCVHRYKHQYGLGLYEAIKVIEENINEVKIKLDEEKFGILQFIINEHKILKFKKFYDYADSEKEDDEDITENITEIVFDEIKLIDIHRNWRIDNEKETIIKRIGKIKIDKLGKISFEYLDREDNYDIWKKEDLTKKLKEILIGQKLNEIEKAIKGRIEKLEKHISEFNTNIDNIKTKCAKYLILQDLRDDGG